MKPDVAGMVKDAVYTLTYPFAAPAPKECAEIADLLESLAAQLAEANECERGNFLRAEHNLKRAERAEQQLAERDAEIKALKVHAKSLLFCCQMVLAAFKHNNAINLDDLARAIDAYRAAYPEPK